jgi:dolichol-phosphate mannosyltransferase
MFGVVVPCYREAETIGRLVDALQRLPTCARIVIVDDSPDDQTERAVSRYLRGEAGPVSAVGPSSPAVGRVTYIHRTRKDGRGSAVLAGLEVLATDETLTAFIEMDADYSHDPAEIAGLVATLGRADMVIASRYLPASEIVGWPIGRHVFSAASNRLARRVLGIPLADYTNGFRCYCRRAADIVRRECGHAGRGFISLSETLVNLHCRGLRIVEVPTRFVNRQRGESSLSRREVMSAAIGLVQVARLKRRLDKGGSKR